MSYFQGRLDGNKEHAACEQLGIHTLNGNPNPANFYLINGQYADFSLALLTLTM